MCSLVIATSCVSSGGKKKKKIGKQKQKQFMFYGRKQEIIQAWRSVCAAQLNVVA